MEVTLTYHLRWWLGLGQPERSCKDLGEMLPAAAHGDGVCQASEVSDRGFAGHAGEQGQGCAGVRWRLGAHPPAASQAKRTDIFQSS